MKIYIDSDFKCYTSNNKDGTLREIETEFFDGKCTDFIEGYRFVPEGENWTRSDNDVFVRPMIAPWKPYPELDNAQRKYEKEKINAYEQSLLELGVEL